MNVSHPLPRNVRSFTGLIILLGTLVLGACANVPGGGQARSIRPVIIDGLDVAFMSAVIEQGFGEIHERAYTEPNLDDLFAAAIQELDRIDPNIWFMVTPEDVFIIAGEDQIAPLGKTPRGDVNAWIEISLRAILAARQASIPFRLADSEVFYSALFDGALSTLDQYSRYSGAREATRNRVYRDGSVGLGMHVVAAPEGALVRNVVDHGPAARAGIMIDDVIVSADGEPLAEKSLPEILFNLHGEEGDVVVMDIKRPALEETFRVEAAHRLIVPDTVNTHVVDGILEMHLRNFSQHTAQEVEDAYLDAKAEANDELRGVILDLRGDPGGLLDQAIAVADLFLDSGSISELRGRHSGSNQSYKAKRGDITGGLPMAVIVDGRAASATEILAAALQDNARAAVVGTVTLGKGSVQTLIKLPNDGEIALTWSRASTPLGVGLHGLGILPDVCLSGETAPAGAIISDLFVSPNPMFGARAAWRNPQRGSESALTALRGACPAEMRAEHSLDLEVARRLVSDPAVLSIAVPDPNAQLAVTP